MKSYKILYAFIAILVFSCTDEIGVQESQNTNEVELTSFSQNSEYMGVQAMYIDNGTPQNCTNNILMFSDVDHYNQVLEALEDLIESHEDNFVNQYDHLNEDDLNDDALNDIEESTGHNEYLPLIHFEKQLSFCSLRNMLTSLEEFWLSDQTQGTLDISTWPWDYLYLDDEFESTLLNEQGEVIIGRELYKYYEDGYIVINITNFPNLSDALTDLNNGVPPNQVADDYRPFIEVFEDPVTNNNPQNGPCIESLNQTKLVPVSANAAGLALVQLRTSWRRYTLRSRVRSFEWKGDHWKKRRMHIASGFLEGTTISTYNQDCMGVSTITPNWKSSIKRKNKRTYKNRVYKDYAPHKWAIVPGLHTTETWHYVDGHVFTIPVPFY